MKKKLAFFSWSFYLGVLGSMLWISPANAYIDPGSGSIIFQAIVGGALALGVGIKIFWRKITGVFSRKDTKDS